MFGYSVKGYGRTALLGLGLLTAVWSTSAAAACRYTVTNSWGNGFTAAIRITNDTNTTVNSWQVNWSYTRNSVTNAWNAQLSGNYTASNLTWNGRLNPGQSVEFGLQGASNGGAIETPDIRGALCSAATTSSTASSVNSVASSAAAANIAGLASASTSYVSPWERLSAVNDNSNPSHSNDKSAGAYGNWNNPNSIQWVQYDWPQSYRLESTQVYWFDDNGGVLTPTRAYVEYWNGSSWINAGNVPLAKNAFNTLVLNNIVTNRLRVSMLNTQQSTGILEWRVLGTATGGTASSSLSSSSSSVTPASSSARSSSSAVSSSSIASSPSSSVLSSSLSSRSSLASSSASSTPVAQCDAHTWPNYEPDLNYDLRTDFGQVDTSKFRIYYGCPQNVIAGVKTMGRFAFIWGHNRNPSITDADIDRVLRNLNEDADYIHNVMGWPVDRLQQEGYFSNVYLYGSGLCTDRAANTERGGWQSGINGYPMVLLSYYPVVTPSERGGITHEFIHTIMATRGNKAAWFNEGGNTWLQMNLEASRNNQYGVGFLDATSFLAPHMPIENYSGWLQDGSFGGPNAEGVNRSVNGQQISTWREYLGGNQYNSAFAHFLAEHVSKGANGWIWAKGPHNHILRSLASGAGEEQTQRMIMEFRARQAMVDFGPWSNGFKVPINNNWGRTINAERIAGGIWQDPGPHRLTFYAETRQEGSLLIPKTETLPGWSGANQIPLRTNGNQVRVNFQPLAQNMRIQLAYRAADGTAVYSKPAASGEVCLNLNKAPKNGVVVAIVSNVDYLYNGEETRTRKHDYRLQLINGVSGTATLYDKHYQ
ncbi:cellulose-binding domain-containing protein [Cellvibrio japonicus]|uniref:Carbohydrate binding protein, putative, cbp2B n=1 Tax=Cellvibrio japonicus (strain Ueda107) TaxID=498211 RepID=B3PDE8_CELJU|nr:cellulose-binding domain-containing protein [Cellvibrio japonicus]ACE83838.1 carbohydrate binding protein, putative, cbp2B [Cellvibrio japonicus Ueda107]QEI13397.1 sugar-binding protein [Cellvibrio japonicus]QEI16971.1 sugar-binding protein [Cellvibrio japonicus]QEI20549.1 sugar-binding protein [Cellvibrio japonicus]